MFMSFTLFECCAVLGSPPAFFGAVICRTLSTIAFWSDTRRQSGRNSLFHRSQDAARENSACLLLKND